MVQKHHKFKIWSILVGLVFLLGNVTIISAQYGVGDTVQNFKLKDVDGNFVSLYNYQGKVILLNFFTTW